MNKELIKSFLNEICDKAKYVGEIFDITPSELLERFVDYCEEREEPVKKLSVSGEFVEKWLRKFWRFDWNRVYIVKGYEFKAKRLIKTMLKEAGVEVIKI